MTYKMRSAYKREEDKLDKGRNLSPIPGIVESQADVQARNGLQVLVVEGEVVDGQVLQQAGLLVGLRNDADSSLGVPSQEHLGGGDLVLFSDSQNDRVLEQRLHLLDLRMIQLHKGLRPEGRVAGDNDVLALDVLNQALLDQVRMVLDLEQLRSDLCASEQVLQKRAREVGHPDGLDLANADQVLHGAPGVEERHVLELPAALAAVEVRWILLLERNELLRDREVDVEHIQIVQA